MPDVVRRHYLPAGHIGYFSPVASPVKLRKRAICVLDKDRDRTFWTSAERVGFAKRIYGYSKHWDWDSYFQGSEVCIHQPVENLIADGPRGFRLIDWTRLAWYIAMLIARGPDLEYKLAQIARETGQDPRRITPGYVIDAQRIGSAVVRARWEFVWSQDRDLVLGDRGVAGFYHPRWGTFAYFVPLRRNLGVSVGAGPYAKRVTWTGAEWSIEIGSSLAVGNLPNCWTWHSSRKQLYGADPGPLLALRNEARAVPEELRPIAQLYQGAQLLGGSVEDRIRDEVVLLNLLAGTPAPVGDEATEFII